MSIEQWRQQPISELKKVVLSGLFEKQFRLRMQNTTGGLRQIHLLKEVKRDIARVLTIIAEREKSEGK